MEVVVVVDSEKFNEYLKIRDEVQELLNETYQDGVRLRNTIKNEKEWGGEAYEKFLVYMDLIINYQQLFSDSHADNPLQMSKAADQAFENGISTFKEKFPEYMALGES